MNDSFPFLLVGLWVALYCGFYAWLLTFADPPAGNAPEFPPLVGYGCEGVGDTSLPLYAYEEDAFPFCVSIVATTNP